jgi:hypothetical protein
MHIFNRFVLLCFSLQISSSKLADLIMTVNILIYVIKVNKMRIYLLFYYLSKTHLIIPILITLTIYYALLFTNKTHFKFNNNNAN